MYDSVRNIALRRLACAVGVSEIEFVREAEPSAVEHIPVSLPRAIVIAVRLEDAVIDSLFDRPTPLYFHHYRQANYWLDRIAFEVSQYLMSKGYRAVSIPASQMLSSRPPYGHLSHRVLAWSAGLGWIGRSRLLVTPEFGARVRLVSVLTDAPLPPGKPLSRECGSCDRCLSACPASAIKLSSRDFDLQACYAKLEEFRKLPCVGQHICGLCVKACGGTDREGGAL